MGFFNQKLTVMTEVSAASAALGQVNAAHPSRWLLRFSSSQNDSSELNWLNQLDPDRGSGYGSPSQPEEPKRNRRLGIIFAIVALLILCIAIVGFALYRAGDILNPDSPGEPQVSCQELIDRAMQSSDDSCGQMGPNQVCYGNNTLSAELNSGGQFTEQGDVIGVEQLKRLAASPLSLLSEEWGIAVFKVMANLPRSLPGETVTMIAFGNTTLDNPSNNLQTFYFSSTLGQIECEQVPFDGLMITMPEGTGIRFVVNGAEMILSGDASLQATQNGQMEISLLSGSAFVTANGVTQLVTAGESTSMDLGGPNGTSAVSPPSPPEPLSPEELALACTMTGEFCSPEEITPVSPDAVLATLNAQMGVTPVDTATPIILPTSTASTTPSITLTPSMSLTLSRTMTPTRSPTPSVTTTRTRTPTHSATTTIAGTGGATSTRTNTPGPSSTFTRTFTPSQTRTSTSTRTNTPTFTATNTPTRTNTGTNTNTPTNTATNTLTNTPTITSTSTVTNTPTITNTSTITPTPTNTPLPACGAGITAASLQNPGGLTTLTMDITNSSGATVRLTSLHIVWNTGLAVRILDILLAGIQIGNPNETTSPSDLPAPSPFTGLVTNRDIGNGATSTLTINFQNNLGTVSGFSIVAGFDNSCQVQQP